jgi:hypothetical protein
MFFSISDQAENNFDCYYKIGNWFINVDHGWTVCKTQTGLTLFKGYCDQLPMNQLINNLPVQHNYTGNFCVIAASPNDLKLTHSQPRSFPLWHQQKKLTNFLPNNQSLTQIWVDDLFSHLTVDGTFIFQKNKSTPALSKSMSMNQVIEQSVDLLIQRAGQFKKHHTDTINIYKSGGVDTTLVHALCNHVGINTVKIYSDIEPTDFMLNNKSTFDCFWAYQQLHVWPHHSFIGTGSHGDEYFLRGPAAIAMITAWHNVDFLSLLDQNPQCYHYHYFNREYNRYKFQLEFDQKNRLKNQFPTWNDLYLQILNMLANDHQHWHLGKTVTWTPLKEINIAQWCLNLPIDCLLDNFLNATITKRCIEKLDASLLSSVDTYKNHTEQSI